MKEAQMDIEWRTVQLFLEEDGVFEVELDYENSKKVRCNCTAFKLSAKCKHQKWVRNLIAENDGHYAIQIPVDVDEDDALELMATAAGFREFILKHGKVEVI